MILSAINFIAMFIVSDPSIATTHIGETPRAEIHQPEVTDSRTDPSDVLPRTWVDEEDNRPMNRDDDYETDSDMEAWEVSIDVNGPWGDWRDVPQRYWQTVTFSDNEQSVTVSMVEQYIRQVLRTIPESDHVLHEY